MASLSNINGIFDVHSTGAVQFNGNHGASGQILRSNGNASPTWIDFNSTGFGGDYVPIAGNVTITGAIATDTGINLTVGGTLTGTSATFSGNVTGPRFIGTSDRTEAVDSNDTRSTNPDPEDIGKGVYFDFKSNSTNGLSDGGGYNGMMLWRSYGGGSDLSGGQPIRLSYTANGNLWRQMGTGATSWGTWNKFAIGTGTTAQYIRGDASLATFPTIPPDPTGVYLPLAGGIMSGNIGRSAYNSGYQVGGYNNVGASEQKTNPIHAIGTSYLPTATALSNMYGIGFTSANASYLSLAQGNGWGLYVASDGDARIFLDGSEGDIYATNKLCVNSYANQAGGLLFSAGQTTGTARSLNLRTTNVTSDPSSSDISTSTGITWGQRTDSNPYYIIYPNLENYNSTGNYSKLTIAWHTGIKIGANDAYGGTRFYDDSPDISGASVIMNVGVQNTNVGVVNDLLVGGSVTWSGGGSAESNAAYDNYASKTYNDTARGHLGGYYTSGGTEKPNASIFGAGKARIAMLGSGNLGFGGSWNDVFWMSSYTGGDVKRSTAIISSKYDSTSVWVAKQNYDSSSWGTGYLFWNSGNFTPGNYLPLAGGTMTGAINMGGQNITNVTNIYNNGWFRNQNSNEGLYNTATGNHWSSQGGFWDVGYSGTNGIRLRNGHNGTVLGYLYAETAGEFGLLDKDGNWTFRTNGVNVTELRCNNAIGFVMNASGQITLSSTLTTNGVIQANSSINLKNQITLPASGLSNISGRPAYAIYQEGGAWTYPYPDLCLAMHTGIKLGANASYNGIRFYDDYNMATQVMAVNDSSSPIGAGHVYVNNVLQAGASVRAPIFYDTNTTYYGDFASTSYINALTLVGTLSGQNAYFNQDVGIGFNSGNIGGKLNIQINSSSGIGIKNNLNGVSNPTGLLQYTSASMNSGGYYMVFQAAPTSGSDTNMLLCNLNGNLRNRNNSYGQYSDETIKVNFSVFLSDKLNHNYTYLSNVFRSVNGMKIQQFIIINKIKYLMNCVYWTLCIINNFKYSTIWGNIIKNFPHICLF